MKLKIILVYSFQAIFIADCRLRRKDGSGETDLSVGRRYGSSPERETPIRVFNNQEQSKSDKPKHEELLEKESMKEQIGIEKAAGSFADSLAPNQHYSMTDLFKDLGRRFVPQYPYYEKEKQVLEDKRAEDNFHKEIQNTKLKSESEDVKLLPVRASPDLVLTVAKQSQALEDSKVDNPADELIKKRILRSGDYWDGVWKEDVDANILRTGREKRPLKNKLGPLPKLGTVRTKIMPGTKLYQLISVLRQVSPKFLYVMNVD